MRLLPASVIITCLVFPPVAASQDVGTACPGVREADDACMLQSATTHVALLASEDSRVLSGSQTSLLPAAAASGSTSSCHAGARVWVSRKALLYARDAMVPPILARMTSMVIPDQTGEQEGFTYEVNNFEVTSVVVDLIELRFVEGVGIQFIAGGIQVEIGCRYAFAGTSWYNPVWSTGNLEVSLGRGTEFSGLLALSATGSGKPDITLRNLSTFVDLADVRVKLSSLSWVLEAATRLFRTQAESILKEKISQEVEKLVNEDMAEVVGNMTLLMDLPLDPPNDIAALNVSICQIKTGNNYLSIDVHSRVVDKRNASVVYDRLPVQLPERPPDHFESRMLTATLTKWIFNEALYIFEKADLLRTTMSFNYSMDKRSSSLLDTGGRQKSWWWGPKHMEIIADIASSGYDPIIGLEEDILQVTINSIADVKIRNLDTASEISEFVAAVPVKVNAQVSVADTEPQRLMLKVSYISLTPVKILKSPVGKLPGWLIDGVLKKMVRTVVMPKVDEALAEGFPINSSSGISVSKTSIQISPTSIMGKSDVAIDLRSWLQQKWGHEQAARAMHLARASGRQSTAAQRQSMPVPP